MINSITILGSSSGRNAGDAALLSGIMDEIDSAAGRRLLYEIPTYRPEFVWNTYHNRVRPVSMLPWHGTAGMFGVPTLRSVLRADCSIIYDAMLFDRKLWNPLTNYMGTVWLFLKAAKKAGKTLGFYNVGCGPVTTEWGKKMLYELAESMDFITVRDEDSKNLLRELGVKNENLIVTADAALTVKPTPDATIHEILKPLGFAEEKEFLAINVNQYLNSWAGGNQKNLTAEEFSTTYAAALDEIAGKLQVPILFICTQHHDIPLTTSIMQKMRSAVKKGIFTNQRHSHFDIKGVLARASLLFAMRLHANILCTGATTPAVALSFQKKVSSYYKCLGLPECVMSFDTFSKEALISHILFGWENRAKIKAQLVKRVPELQEDSRKAARLVAAIAGGASVREALGRASLDPIAAVQKLATLNAPVATVAEMKKESIG